MIMKYHITLVHSDVIGKFASSCSLRSLNDFNKPYIAVIVKKRNLGKMAEEKMVDEKRPEEKIEKIII